MTLHPAQRRYLAEDLVRQRVASDGRRFAAPQRAGEVDPNPHQIQAVVFALERFREGGCILADEVGLGKTIEAGLVIRQLIAEGARRVLLVAPKPLLGQWRDEMWRLFGLSVREARGHLGDFDGEGLFSIGREAAGSERGAAALRAARPFDLCVIDEAHEMFGGLHRRFDARGEYLHGSGDARTAGRLYEVMCLEGRTPMLVLTATPIQNSLAELWSLVRYVDPSGTLLGDLPTFRRLFCGADDRTPHRDAVGELRRRIEVVQKRTLRRQAQEFLEKPFVDRVTKLFEYEMGAVERALYDDVTDYLLDPKTTAFGGSRGRLILLGYLRLLGSSRRALTASLDRLAARLGRIARGALSVEAEATEAREVNADDGEEHADEPEGERHAFALDRALEELPRVEGFIARAKDLPEDPKAAALKRAVGLALDRGARGEGSGKVVVFTEFIATQEYIRDVLLDAGLVAEREITLFRGDNDTERGREALERYEREALQKGDARPSRDIALRLALVHEFKSAARGVFVSTEAGGKGLNLQFCETLVNYDLPWNPQRIEQRIGRCHRYGQTRDVLVVNFIAKDNEAERLLFDILTRKLELFGTVLSASDDVLHRPGERATGIVSGIDMNFEEEMKKALLRARSAEEKIAEIRALRDRSEEARRSFDETQERTAAIIERRFDDEVREVFRRRKEELPGALAAFDRDLDRLVTAHLESCGVPHRRINGADAVTFEVDASDALPTPLSDGARFVAGRAADVKSLHLSHPIVLVALDEARALAGPFGANLDAQAFDRRPGDAARLVVEKVRFGGFERVERLVAVAIDTSGRELDAEPILTSAALTDAPPPSAPSIDDARIEDAIEERLFTLEHTIDAEERGRFERAIGQIERYVEDRLLMRRLERRELEAKRSAALARRDAAMGSSQRERAEADLVAVAAETEVIEATIEALERRDDPTYRASRDRLYARRGAPPERRRLIDLELRFT